ncbi:lysozyme inhibitor LprI family protein [Prosthecobacter sp.]
MLTLGLNTVSAQDKPLDAKAAKAAFDKADRALNTAWAAAKQALPEEEFNKLKEDQRAWVEYRDYLARWPMYTRADAQGELALDLPAYFEAAAGLEGMRSEWLKGLIREWKDEALTGYYHGARAYFDGNYVKVKALDAKAQAKIVKAAKSGDLPEE